MLGVAAVWERRGEVDIVGVVLRWSGWRVVWIRALGILLDCCVAEGWKAERERRDRVLAVIMLGELACSGTRMSLHGNVKVEWRAVPLRGPLTSL